MTLALSIPEPLENRLVELARRTGKSESALAAQAITAFVDRELATVEAIQRSQRALEAGQVVNHDEVMREAYEIIERAKQRQ
jgi:predicted transcriptional regulator